MLLCSNIVNAQSIFKGKTITCNSIHSGATEMIIESYSVDNNGNAKMIMLMKDNNHALNCKITFEGVDKSTNRLFSFYHDKEKVKITDIDLYNDDILIPGDGTITINGKKYKSQSEWISAGKSGDQWKPLINFNNTFKDIILKMLPKSMSYQITYMDDNKFLAPDKMEKNSITYLTFEFIK